IRFDLELSLAERDDEVRGVVAYRTALFDASTVERLASHLGSLLAAMASAPDRRLSDVELMGDAERERVLSAWNDTAREYPPLPAHLLFSGQAARTPDAVAVLAAAGPLTYAELDARADALAGRLRALGVGPEVPVGLCVERTAEMVVGVLGIWKAGGAYVPLDPAYPAERLGLIARDAALRVVVASDEAAGAVPELAGEIVVIDTPEGEDRQHGDSPPPERGRVAAPRPPGGGPPVSRENLAYVIYTSGSTGAPKGVHVEHGSLSNLLHAAREAFGVRADDVVPVLASYAFDIWLFETILPLSVGAAVRLVDRERVMDPAGLVAEVSDATTLHAVPALMRQVAREAAASAEPRLAGLRRLFVGGDVVPPDLLAEMRETFPSAEAYVTYGPTEATVLASAYRVPPTGAIAGHRIGAALGNVRLYVCDALGSAQPTGVPGELWIGGAGVARGYGGRPELTAERFVPDALSGDLGARVYRSGDRVRWRADGVLEFLGRVDQQVKVRGFRIEPGEVEAALLGHPSVREAVVVVREDGGERRLVGYVVAAEGAAVDAGELRAWLKGRLPEYMVPPAVVELETLPLTPTGKVDRRALPAPDASGGGEYVAPRGEVEERLAAIWASVLGVERVGIHDDFFALGGHSLLATRVTSRVREVFGVELPLRAVFEAPTVAGLAGWLSGPAEQPAGPSAEGEDGSAPPGSAGSGRAAAAEDGIRRVPRDAPLPLSFAQQRLWFIDRLEPGSAVYNISLTPRLGGELDEAALERALGEVIRRHEALRTTFREVDGSPVQVISPFGGFTLPIEDLTGLPEADREAAVRRRATEEAMRPFDLATGPLFRATLLRVDEESYALLLTMHHIVSDGWSMDVLFRDISALYTAYRAGKESPLPELPVQYADYAIWQREQLQGAPLERQLSY
ncbi:MAG TPA: amino acid adenylation domain-containing protein, partial [Longimicrobiaceae bacterium]|nr:amino acid adenylation domain-containing protein [Longimicrobiaceae bacterium]